LRRSTLIVSGMVRVRGYAARRRDEGQRDAGVAAGGLDELLAGPEQAALLGVPDHCAAPMRHFTE
jgi:hypothetical protein